MRIGEIFLVVRKAPLGENRAAARDDAGHAPGRHGDIAQQHAGVHGEVVDALFCLLDERVAVDLPREILGTPTDLFERLINGNRSNRHRRVAQDPFARLVDVLPRRKIHHRVGAPQRRPAQLLHFLVDRRAHSGVADVGVDLHREVPADDHRLELGMIDVCRDDGAAARHFGSHELGVEALAKSNELHLGGDDAAARVVKLRDRSSPHLRRSRPRGEGSTHLGRSGRHDRQAARPAGSIAAGVNPRLAQQRQPFPDVVSLRTAGVVDAQGRFTATEGDLAHRDAQVARFDIDLLRIRKRRREIRLLQRWKRMSCSHGKPWKPRKTPL